MPKTSKKSDKKELKYFLGIVLFAITVCLVVLAVYVGVKLIVNPTDIMVVEKGVVSEEETTTGYIIRQETVIEGIGCDNIKNEGDKVAAGAEVFRYYIADESSINAQISELNEKIQASLDGQMKLFPNDVKALQNQIANRVEQLKTNNNVQEITEYKSDINSYMSKISKIAGESSQAGAYISDLIAQRTELENKLSNSSKYITTNTSGIISYRIDGFESELTVDKIPTLTSEYLESLSLKKGQIASTATGVCKVINNYECYIAIISDSKNALSVRNR